jgi:O-antigen/teichoic acid export membrane protein
MVLVVFATDVTLARILGPEGKGYVAILTVTPALVGIFAQVGLDYGLNRRGHLQPSSIRGVFSSALAIGTLTSLLVAAVLFLDLGGSRGLLYGAVPPDLHNAVLGALAQTFPEVWFALVVMFIITSGFPVLQARMRIVRRAGVLLVVSVAAVRSTSVAQAVTFIVWGQVLVSVATAGWGAWLGGYRLDKLVSVLPLLGDGLKAYPARLAERLQSRVDYVLLGILASGSAVGVYSVATAMAEMIFFVTGSTASVLFSHRTSEGRDLHWAVFRLIVPTSILGALLIGSAGAMVLPLVYGTSFSGSVPLLWMLLPGVVGMSLVQVASPQVVQAGRAHVVSVAQTIGLALNIGLNFTFIPEYGAFGAAFASSVSYLSTLGVIVWDRATRSDVPLHTLILPSRGDLVRATDALQKVAASVRGRR